MINLPDSFEWRYCHFHLGLGDAYHPTSPIPGIKRVMVWFEEELNCWLASIVPNESCTARESLVASLGDTPHSALDTEVISWIAAALALPGSSELLRHARASVSAAHAAAAAPLQSPESDTVPGTRT